MIKKIDRSGGQLLSMGTSEKAPTTIPTVSGGGLRLSEAFLDLLFDKFKRSTR